MQISSLGGCMMLPAGAEGSSQAASFGKHDEHKIRLAQAQQEKPMDPLRLTDAERI